MTWPADAVIKRVDEALTTFLAERATSLTDVGAELEPVMAAATSLVLDGGKRLRPTFAYFGWRAAAAPSTDDTALITAAASLELLHACALVHDDVMDSSATRRGKPSAHAAFADLHRRSGWHGDPDSFGASAAILLGDLLLSWADALFDSAALGAATRRVWDEMRQLVMAGQYLDVLVQARGEFSAQDALRVAMYKTSKYTVEGPLHFGAAAANATPATYTALTEYGIPLGEAFQLRDDVLGVFGDSERTGKPTGDDLREGKRTLLVALAMESADSTQAELLQTNLGVRDLDDATIAALANVIVATGALDQVEARIAERTVEARAALHTSAINDEAREALDALAVAATQRHT